MNRIILIGNGFDLAHGLKTSYRDFFYWFWGDLIKDSFNNHTDTIKNPLCTISITKGCGYHSWSSICYQNWMHKRPKDFEAYKLLKDDQFFTISKTPFFQRISHSIETKGWVDIENEYYELLIGPVVNKVYYGCSYKDLNEQLDFIKSKLIEYLNSIVVDSDKYNSSIQRKIFSPINPQDICVAGVDELLNHIRHRLDSSEIEWREFFKLYDVNPNLFPYSELQELKDEFSHCNNLDDLVNNRPAFRCCLYPDQIMFLNFNYTSTADLYIKKGNSEFTLNHIHGKLSKLESVIFGYGDELDDNYKGLVKLNQNEYLKNVKSIRYLESDNYRKMLSFIESAPYQIFIMGHSCGNSDRTLLNTLFEHKNCASIKPFYYTKEDGTDNYMELVQNISRNFTSMQLMRDRVVNKTYCETII